MKQFILKFSLFLLLALAFLKMMDGFYTRYVSRHKNVCQKPDWIMNHSNSTIDFAVIGNSRVYNMIDINAIEKITGKNGINLGVTGSTYAENYVLLDQFLKAGNHIKTLIIQADMQSLNSVKAKFPFQNHNYIHLLSDTTVFEAFKDNNTPYKPLVWKYIPFVRYMEFNKRFVLFKILKGGFECISNNELDTTKGTAFLYQPKFQNNYYRDFWTINQLDKKYLNKMIQLSKQNNMRIVIYTAPIYSKYLGYQVNHKDIFRYIKHHADSLHVPYFNFCEYSDSLCLNKDLYFDDRHMNITGTRKFSILLGDSIKPYLN